MSEKPNSTDDAERWLIHKEITLGRFIHNSSLESCYAQASDFAGGIANTFADRIRMLRKELQGMRDLAESDYRAAAADDTLDRDNLQFHCGQLID